MNQAHPPTSRSEVWTIAHGDVDVHGIGDRTILRRKFVGLICSVKCPGSVMIKTFDAIRALRDARVVVAGGFHSPMEKECLEFLLRGAQPVVVVLAKCLGNPRMPQPWREAIGMGRLLVLSPFGNGTDRTTMASAQSRNEFIASSAAAVLIPHASPGGKAEAIARCVVKQGKPLYTFDVEENQGLFALGARSFDQDVFATNWVE